MIKANTKRKLPEDGKLSEEPDKKSATSKLKSRRDPLPMKLRAFPQSFWQEPNTSGIVLPTSYCSHLEEEQRDHCNSRVIGEVDTDLLFSLFRNVNGESGKVVPVAKRGRPRKPKPTHPAPIRDDDPYFTSAIVPVIQAKDEDRIAQEQQVLALISVSGERLPVKSSYTERLSDLVATVSMI